MVAMELACEPRIRGIMRNCTRGRTYDPEGRRVIYSGQLFRRIHGDGKEEIDPSIAFTAFSTSRRSLSLKCWKRRNLLA